MALDASSVILEPVEGLPPAALSALAPLLRAQPEGAAGFALRIGSDAWTLFRGDRGGECVGWLVLDIDAPTCHIVHAAAADSRPGDLIAWTLPEIERIAAAAGCSEVTARTRRAGVAQKMGAAGYRAEFYMVKGVGA